MSKKAGVSPRIFFKSQMLIYPPMNANKRQSRQNHLLLWAVPEAHQHKILAFIGGYFFHLFNFRYYFVGIPQVKKYFNLSVGWASF